VRGRVELSTRAVKDLRRLDRAMRDRITRVLRDQLCVEPRRRNLDVAPLQGRAPWSRLRLGSHRVIFRPLSAAELAALDADERSGILVERVIHRRELERAVKGLL